MAHGVFFVTRTTSLRVGGRAARRSCLPGLRRGGGRQAGAIVLSCLVWRCELTTRQVRSASECVRRSHCAAPHTPTQIIHRTHLSGGRADSVQTAAPDTTKTVLSGSCLAWRCELAISIKITMTMSSPPIFLWVAEAALYYCFVRPCDGPLCRLGVTGSGPL